MKFWDSDADRAVFFGGAPIQVPYGDAAVPAGADPVTGRLTGWRDLPRNVVVPDLFAPVGVRGEVVARPTYGLPTRLVRLGPVPTLSYAADVDPAGWLETGTPARMRLFGAGLPVGRAACVRVTLAPPPGATASAPVTLTAGGRSARATLTPSGPAVAGLRLPGLAARANVDARLRAAGPGVELPDGRRVSAQIAAVESAPCASGATRNPR